MRTTASGTSGSHALKGARNNLVERFTESGGLDESNNNCPLLTEADSTPAGRVHVLKSLRLPPRTVNLPLLHLALMTHFKVAESKHASILNDAAQATLQILVDAVHALQRNHGVASDPDVLERLDVEDFAGDSRQVVVLDI